MKLDEILITNEDYILARYQTLLKKQNIKGKPPDLNRAVGF